MGVYEFGWKRLESVRVCFTLTLSLKSEPAAHGALKNVFFVLYFYDTCMSMKCIDTVEDNLN